MVETGTPRQTSDATVLDVLLEATRALLWIRSPAEARHLATGVVTAFGGLVAPAGPASSDALPVDLSFGDGEPVLPHAPPSSVARMLLERHLPSLVEDIRRAVALGSEADRVAVNAEVDSLTGLPNRRMLGRALGRLREGDAVVMIDLDHFKRVNDTLGHPAGDEVLRVLGRILRGSSRGRDVVGRYGGEEFVVILGNEADPDSFLERLRGAWERDRPQPVTFSAGIARVGIDPSGALAAADHALYRAKEAGRDRWKWAAEGGSADASTVAVAAATVAPSRPGPAFVAYSQIAVPDGGRERLEAAFGDRLGAVDRWPGFRSLEIWSDLGDANAYVMVSWWDSAEAFQGYMRSDDHQRSHDRIPDGDDRPRPRGFRRYRVVAR